MEVVKTILDDGSGKAFDAALRGTLRDGGDLQIITKNDGTRDGHPCLMLTFSVQLPDGTIRQVQTVTTVRNFLASAGAVAGRYQAENDRLFPKPEAKDGDTLTGNHLGMKWEAKLMERFYIVAVEGLPGAMGIAGDETSAKGLGENFINQYLGSR